MRFIRQLSQHLPWSGCSPMTRHTLLCTCLKFILFDLLWCIQTTFTSFSHILLYVNTLTVSLVLMTPFMLSRKKSMHTIVLLLLDILLICNLMYNRTYNSLIPLDSYLRVSNLTDFQASVTDQLRWYDALLPMETLLYVLIAVKMRGKRMADTMRSFLTTTLAAMSLSVLGIWVQGGLGGAFSRLQTPNWYTCAGPVYTVFIHLLYDGIHENTPFDAGKQARMRKWMEQQPAYQPLPDSVGKRNNLIIVFCESLESWCVGQRIEGKEITPNLNKLIAEETTLYAPYVLTQVRGGRSIDAQLMVNAGLLPCQNGCYAFKYPDNTYMTLTKAMKELRNAKAYLLTVDQPIIWNQQTAARGFGFDQIISKKDWKQTEASGPRQNLPDEAFVDQTIDKMEKGEIWKPGEHAFVQMVTYSGHSPFKLPKPLQRLQLKGQYPEKMSDYIITAHYTDHAMGKLVSYLKSRPDYAETMIVIIGDHEGLAGDRQDICQSPQAKGIVSTHQHTPFIVINSPVGMRYNQVMGQVDQYTTILNLMRLDAYPWKGVGQSIIDAGKSPMAIGSNLNIEPSGKDIDTSRVDHLRQAFDISDMILQYDMMKRPEYFVTHR